MKSILLKALPHIAAIVVFIAISVAYFSPITEGYELRQGDIDHWRGMSKELVDYRLEHDDEPLWTNSMFGGMPAYQISTVHGDNLMSHVDQLVKLYLPGPIGILFISMLGMYIFGLCMRINPWLSIVGGIGFGLATINILFLGAGHVSKVNAIAYMAPALGGLLLATRGKWILGTAVFALFFSLNVSANHLQMTYYLVLLLGAVALAEAIRLIIEKKAMYLLKTGAALAIAGGVAVLPSMSNLLTTYEYSKFTTRGATELTISPEGEDIAAAAATGLETDYILQYNFGEGEAWSLIIPNANGGQSGAIGADKSLLQNVPREFRENIGQSNRYWGQQLFTGGAFYFGAIIMLLFVLGLIFVKDVIKWPFLVLTIICISLASQNPGGLNDFFIHKFPLYNKFRDSKMILVVLQVMASGMALVFLDRIIKQTGLLGNTKALLATTGGLIFMMIIITASPSIVTDFLSNGEVQQFSEVEQQLGGDPQQLAMYDGYKTSLMDVRAEIFQADAIRSLLFILVAAIIVVLTYLKKIPAFATIAAMAILVLVDQFPVCQRYLNSDKQKGQFMYYTKPAEKVAPYLPSQADMAILDAERENVADFDSKTKALVSAMKSSSMYQDVRDKSLLEKIGEFGVLGLNSDYRVLALGGTFSDAGTSYFHKSIGGYHGAKLKRYQELIDFYLKQELEDLNEKMRSATDITFLEEFKVLHLLNTKYIVYNPSAPPIENPYAMGNAWFVKNVSVVDNANDEILTIGSIDLKEEAVIRKEFEHLAAHVDAQDSTATIELTEYATNRLTYASSNSQAQVAVFSEIYYPAGWICTIDNKEVETMRADYLLRGVFIPAGEHTIEWHFHPESYYKGSTYSLAGSILLMLLVLGSIAFEWKKTLAAS